MLCTSAFPTTVSISSRNQKVCKLSPIRYNLVTCFGFHYMKKSEKSFQKGLEMDSLSMLMQCIGAGNLLNTMFPSLQVKFPLHSSFVRRKKNITLTLLQSERSCAPFFLSEIPLPFTRSWFCLSLLLLRCFPANLFHCKSAGPLIGYPHFLSSAE